MTTPEAAAVLRGDGEGVPMPAPVSLAVAGMLEAGPCTCAPCECCGLVDDCTCGAGDARDAVIAAVLGGVIRG